MGWTSTVHPTDTASTPSKRPIHPSIHHMGSVPMYWPQPWRCSTWTGGVAPGGVPEPPERQPHSRRDRGTRSRRVSRMEGQGGTCQRCCRGRGAAVGVQGAVGARERPEVPRHDGGQRFPATSCPLHPTSQHPTLEHPATPGPPLSRRIPPGPRPRRPRVGGLAATPRHSHDPHAGDGEGGQRDGQDPPGRHPGAGHAPPGYGRAGPPGERPRCLLLPGRRRAALPMGHGAGAGAGLAGGAGPAVRSGAGTAQAGPAPGQRGSRSAAGPGPPRPAAGRGAGRAGGATAPRGGSAAGPGRRWGGQPGAGRHGAGNAGLRGAGGPSAGTGSRSRGRQGTAGTAPPGSWGPEQLLPGLTRTSTAGCRAGASPPHPPAPGSSARTPALGPQPRKLWAPVSVAQRALSEDEAGGTATGRGQAEKTLFSSLSCRGAPHSLLRTRLCLHASGD